KRQSNPCVWNRIGHHRDIQYHLNSHMSHDPCSQQAPAQILGMGCCDHQSPDQQAENQDYQTSSCKAGLFTYNRKNHIILSLWHKSQLLKTAPQALSENPSAANGVQTLDRLKSLLVGLGISPDSQTLQPVAGHSKKNSDKNHSNPADSHKRQVSGIGYKNQDHADSQNNNGSTQVVGSHQSYDRKKYCHPPCHIKDSPVFFFSLCDHPGKKQYHSYLGKF